MRVLVTTSPNGALAGGFAGEDAGRGSGVLSFEWINRDATDGDFVFFRELLLLLAASVPRGAEPAGGIL